MLRGVSEKELGENGSKDVLEKYWWRENRGMCGDRNWEKGRTGKWKKKYKMGMKRE